MKLLLSNESEQKTHTIANNIMKLCEPETSTRHATQDGKGGIVEMTDAAILCVVIIMI